MALMDRIGFLYHVLHTVPGGVTMTSKLGRLAQGIMEAGWLMALVVAPLYFNVQTDRVFEPDKISLVRWLAIIVGLAWITWAVDSGWSPRAHDESLSVTVRRILKIPLVAPTLLVVLSYFISTVFSVAPHTSLWGSYQRLQGLWTTYSYILIFFVALHRLRQRDQLERLITIIIATSLPIGLYGILQHYGVDPLPWGGDVQTRIAAHMGNAIFVAAYLIMVMFLTGYRIIRSFVGILMDVEGKRGYTDAILGGIYLFIFAVQVIALIFSQSRGPFLGFVVGSYVFILVAVLALRIRYYRAIAGAWVTLALLGAAFLVVFNLPHSPLEPLREMPYVGRLGKILDVSRQNPTGRVRVLIWEGAVDLILPHEPLNVPPDMHPDALNPLRPLIGYGPEAMWVAYNRFYRPELAHIEKRNASPDRSHNETFDSLIRTGFLGFSAYVWVFVSVFYFVLSWLGLIASRRDRGLFLGLWFGGGIGAVLAARILDGSWRFFGVALPFGFILGLVAYVTLIGLTRRLPDVPREERERYLLLLALLATIAAHYVEVNFGIAIVSTRTYFWTLAAVLVAIGTQRLSLAPTPVPVASPSTEPPSRSRKRRKRRERPKPPSSPRPSISRDRTFWVYALFLAFIFITLAYEFIINLPTGHVLTNQVGRILTNSLFTRVTRGIRVSNPHQFYMLLFTWFVLAPLFVGEVARKHRVLRLGNWLVGIGIDTLSAWGGFFVMAWLQARFLARAAQLQVQATQHPEAILRFVDHMAHFPVTYYILLLVFVFSTGAVLGWVRGHSVPGTQRMTALITAGISLVLILYVGFGPALHPIQADIYFKQAKAFHKARRYTEAEIIYRKVLDLAPHEDYYYLFLGKAYLEHAQQTKDAQKREELLQQAEQVLLQAQHLNPLNTDHTANLGRFYITRANMTRDKNLRRQYVEKAVHYFEQAVSLSPHNARLRDEYAVALLQAGREKEALEQLHISLQLDDTYYLTYLYLADYYRNQQNWQEAEQYYRKALERRSRDIQILSNLAYVYAREGKIDEAIKYNLEVLKLAPNDLATLRNLALLYREIGQYDLALQYARQALSLAGENEKPALQALVSELEKLREEK